MVKVVTNFLNCETFIMNSLCVILFMVFVDVIATQSEVKLNVILQDNTGLRMTLKSAEDICSCYDQANDNDSPETIKFCTELIKNRKLYSKLGDICNYILNPTIEQLNIKQDKKTETTTNLTTETTHNNNFESKGATIAIIQNIGIDSDTTMSPSIQTTAYEGLPTKDATTTTTKNNAKDSKTIMSDDRKTTANKYFHTTDATITTTKNNAKDNKISMSDDRKTTANKDFHTTDATTSTSKNNAKDSKTTVSDDRKTTANKDFHTTDATTTTTKNNAKDSKTSMSDDRKTTANKDFHTTDATTTTTKNNAKDSKTTVSDDRKTTANKDFHTTDAVTRTTKNNIKDSKTTMSDHRTTTVNKNFHITDTATDIIKNKDSTTTMIPIMKKNINKDSKNAKKTITTEKNQGVTSIETSTSSSPNINVKGNALLINNEKKQRSSAEPSRFSVLKLVLTVIFSFTGGVLVAIAAMMLYKSYKSRTRKQKIQRKSNCDASSSMITNAKPLSTVTIMNPLNDDTLDTHHETIGLRNDDDVTNSSKM